MNLSFLLFFFFNFACSNERKDHTTYTYDLFRFVTSNHKQFVLSREDFANKRNTDIISSSFNRYLKPKRSDDSKQWYYVHILNNYLDEVQKYVKISVNDEIIKYLYFVFITRSITANIQILFI
ncbi:hypothetical protein M9Y10_003255 [Tritrichomonas musculus]|uniref:Lipoprotein n=1 Tax=Tritrichomonas musculus TaxID=1915356 RepID=A0ABR2JNZ9_9EUKA